MEDLEPKRLQESPRRPHGNKGKPKSVLHRQRIAAARRGKKHTFERCRKIALGNRKPKPAVSIALKGKTKSETHKNNLRNSALKRLQAVREWEISYRKADEEEHIPFFFTNDDYNEEDFF